MVQNVTYKGTFFSEIKIPAFKGLLEKEMENNFHVTNTDKTLHFKITNTWNLKEFPNGKIFEIVKSESTFDIQTDGSISVEDMYELYVESIGYLRNYLNVFEKSQGMIPTDMPAPPLEKKKHQFQGCCNWFLAQQN